MNREEFGDAGYWKCAPTWHPAAAIFGSCLASPVPTGLPHSLCDEKHKTSVRTGLLKTSDTHADDQRTTNE